MRAPLDSTYSFQSLDDLCEITLGNSPPGESYNKNNNGPLFIQGRTSFGRKYAEPYRWTSEPSRMAKEGDVLITVRAPAGAVNMANSDMCIGRGVTSLRMDNENNNFLYYLLKWLEPRWDKLADGTTYNSITKSDLKSLRIPIPPENEQKKIQNILVSVDRKIELNRELAGLLEETAHAVYESWFEAYEPYNIPDDENIPNDFEQKKLDKTLEFQRGFSYSGEDITEVKQEGEYPMINLGTIEPGGGYNQSNMKYLTSEPKNKYQVNEGDLVISHTDMTQDREILGSPLLIPSFGSDTYISHHLYSVNNSIIPEELLYFFFVSDAFKPKAESYASGTTVLSFSSDISSNIKINVPPEKEQKNYVNVVRPMFDNIEQLRKETNQLEELRDYLLPQLLSGEVTIAEKEVSEGDEKSDAEE